jgi:hypothetical protein
MMRVTVRTVCLLLLFGLYPLTAHAQSDLLDWLAQYSGPGPFHTNSHKPLIQSANFRVVCIKDDGKGGHRADTCFLDDIDGSIKIVIGATFSWTPSTDPRFKDATDPNNTQPINESRIEGTYSYRISPMLDVGVSAGAVVLTGVGFNNQTHPFFAPVQMTFVPFGFARGGWHLKWGRVLKLRFADRYVLGDIDAKNDFGSTSAYLTHGEFNPSFGITLDFLPLFAKVKQ